MRQVGIIAAAGIYALDHHIERLKEDHNNAKRLALGLQRLKGISVNPEHVETNILLLDVVNSTITAPLLVEAMKKERILIHAFGRTQIRLVTHLDVSSKDIEAALGAFEKVLGKRS